MKKTILILLFLVVIVFAVLNTVSAVQSTERVSIADSEPNSDSSHPSITPDGHYIAFESEATNIVAGDTNNYKDIFVKNGWSGSVIRLSTNSTGGEANGDSYNPVITPYGRYVAFTSYATNLVSDDTNGVSDVFVKDGWTGQITRVSTTATGAQATGGGSWDPSITPDGRYIAFESAADNLVSGDTNSVRDIFVKDGWTGQITRVSTTSTGAEATGGGSYKAVITPNGRYITFGSYASNLVSGDTNTNSDVFVKDGWTGQTTRVSTTSTGEQANGGNSLNAVITPDGRYIAFESSATNLVADDTNGDIDVFVKDGWTGAITRVSTSSTDLQSDGDSWCPSITPDGRYITFITYAQNLINFMGVPMDLNGYTDVYLKDGWSGQITRVSINSNGEATNGDSYDPVITPDGKYIAYYSYADGIVTGDLNAASDVFAYDMVSGRNVRISTSKIAGLEANGDCYDPVITPDGRYIVFSSYANNLVSGDTNGQDVFVHDKVTNQTIRASTTLSGGQANGNSYNPSITPDGRYVTFSSFASNLVSGDTNGNEDIFVKDMLTGVITRVSTTSSNSQAIGGNSCNAAITPDGRYIVFTSYASNLVSDDTNGVTDVFVKDGWNGQITRVSTSATGAQATGGSSFNAVITPNGRYITFESEATNLVSGDTNGKNDVFVKDGWTGAITRVSTTLTGGQSDNDSGNPSITPDGRYIVFESIATNLIAGDINGFGDVFVKDGWTGVITRVSTTSTGAETIGGGSWDAAITPDGRYIAFTSDASNLVAGDTNGITDVFVKDGWTGQITRVSTTATGAQSDGNSYNPVITPDGKYVAFQSGANLLGYVWILPLDSNGAYDIYVKGLW